MTNNEIKKGASENTCEKIKAIYPHITVSGDVDKPYYSIDWYDIEKQEMYRGYSSYKLPLVRKWLQENFEVVEADIDDLINRQKANAEGLTNAVKFLNEQLSSAKAEAVKEFADRLSEKAPHITEERFPVLRNEIDNLVKEMVGEASG